MPKTITISAIEDEHVSLSLDADSNLVAVLHYTLVSPEVRLSRTMDILPFLSATAQGNLKAQFNTLLAKVALAEGL